jgi:hypothetical protein
VAFNLVYLIGDIQAFFIPSYLIVGLWASIGLVALGRAVPHLATALPFGEAPWPGLGQAQVPIALILLCGLLLGALAWSNLARVDLSNDRSARQGWESFLAASIPTQAIVVSNDRNEIMPLWYLQYVEGRRPDLTGVFPLVTQEPRFAHVGRVISAALATGRPVVLPKPMPGLEVQFEIEEQGIYWQVTGPVQLPGDSQPVGGTLDATLRLQALDLVPTTAAPGSAVAVDLYWEPIAPISADYTTFVHLIGPDGERKAGDDRRPGGDHLPASRWEVGELFRDHHEIVIPFELPGGSYDLVAGAYTYPDMTLLGEPLWATTLKVR